LIARNAVLCAAALIASLPTTSRPLEWIDAVTIAAAVTCLCLVYATVDGLLANAPQLIAFRRDHALPPTAASGTVIR
jgi:hypothetical protein